jgi:uncharacterized membrane protein
MNIKKTRKIFGIVMLLVLVTLIILIFFRPGNIRMWKILFGALLVSFLGSYILRLKKPPETKEERKLEKSNGERTKISQ